MRQLPWNFPTASNLFSLFQISLENFFKIRVLLMEKLHLQPSELDRLPYYEYEYTVQMYNDMLKERKDGEDKKTSERKLRPSP